MLLYGNFACLSLRRGGIHVVVITDGLGLKEEPDPFAFLGVERTGGSAEQLPQTGVDLAVAFVYVAEVRRVALICSLVERIAFFAGVGREIDDGLRCRRSGVPAGGIVTLVLGGVVAVIAFERRAVVERRGGDPTRHGFQCQAGALLHTAELLGQIALRNARKGVVAVVAYLFDDRVDVLALEFRQVVGIDRVVHVGAFAVALQHAVVQVGAQEIDLADTLRQRSGVYLRVGRVVFLDTFENDVCTADVLIERRPESVAGSGVGRGVAFRVEFRTGFPVAFVELVRPAVLGRRTFALVGERRVAEIADMHQRLVGGAHVEIETVDKLFRFVETGENILFRLVALRRLVEVVLAAEQRQGRTAEEQVFQYVFHSRFECFGMVRMSC